MKEIAELRMFSGRELFGSSAKMLERIRRKRRHDEKFLRCKLSIYRGKGAVSRKRLDTTVAIFPGGRVSTLTFWGWRFFTGIRDYIRGIGSSESTRFPEGLVLGNWAKTLHPRNVGFAEIREINSWITSGWKVQFRERETFMKKSWWVSSVFQAFK
jgi:hypothetical protein